MEIMVIRQFAVVQLGARTFAVVERAIEGQPFEVYRKFRTVQEAYEALEEQRRRGNTVC